MIFKDTLTYEDIIMKCRKWLTKHDFKDKPELLIALYMEGYLKEVDNTDKEE